MSKTLRETDCIFCRKESQRVDWEENGFTGRRCECGLLYISPRPEWSEILEGYKSKEADSRAHFRIGSEILGRLNAQQLCASPSSPSPTAGRNTPSPGRGRVRWCRRCWRRTTCRTRRFPTWPAARSASARLFRISFSGELAYEIAAPARDGEALARRVMQAGRRRHRAVRAGGAGRAAHREGASGRRRAERADHGARPRPRADAVDAQGLHRPRAGAAPGAARSATADAGRAAAGRRAGAAARRGASAAARCARGDRARPGRMSPRSRSRRRSATGSRSACWRTGRRGTARCCAPTIRCATAMRRWRWSRPASSTRGSAAAWLTRPHTGCRAGHGSLRHRLAGRGAGAGGAAARRRSGWSWPRRDAGRRADALVCVWLASRPLADRARGPATTCCRRCPPRGGARRGDRGVGCARGAAPLRCRQPRRAGAAAAARPASARLRARTTPPARRRAYRRAGAPDRRSADLRTRLPAQLCREPAARRGAGRGAALRWA